MKISSGIQKQGQTKQQTRLIAQGIEKGIQQYKKRHSEKSRQLDRKLSKASEKSSAEKVLAVDELIPAIPQCSKLPWVLLVASWLGFLFIFYNGLR